MRRAKIRQSHKPHSVKSSKEAAPKRSHSRAAPGIVLKLPRVSYPAKASAATRDAKCLGAGRERPQGLEVVRGQGAELVEEGLLGLHLPISSPT